MYTNLKQTLSLINIEYKDPYYVSLNANLFSIQETIFKLDFYGLYICTQGTIFIEINKKEYKLNKNDFLIIAPSNSIQIRNISQDFKTDILLFEKNFLIKNVIDPFIVEKIILFKNDNQSIINATEVSIKNLTNLLLYLQSKLAIRSKFTDEIIRTIIFSILLEIAETSNKTQTNQSVSNLYLKFKKQVIENILEHKSVSFYADALNVSNKHLIEIVKKHKGKTPHEIIDEILLKEAYVLLGDTSLSISEISFKLQFNSVSAFGRFFKKHTSISPSKYRLKENLQPS